MRKLLTALIPLISLQLSAQVGGSNSFSFLSLPPSARALALGGYLMPVSENDVSQGFENPAALNSHMRHGLSFNNAFYFAGTNYGYVGYASELPKFDVMGSAGIFYSAYGKFQGTDEAGNLTNTFSASEYALHGGFSKQYSPRTRWGANLKLIYSRLESYSALAAALDIGGYYEDTARQITAGALLKNVGVPIKNYTSGNQEPLPFEIQFGVSKRLAHTPFKFILVAHNLQTPNIRYDDPNAQQQTNLFGDTTTTQKEKRYTADKIGRHIAFGTEFYLGTSLRLRVGYNHQRRQEMALSTKRSITGFSFGTGFRINRFHIDYGFAFYHLAGTSHMLSINTKLSEFVNL